MSATEDTVDDRAGTVVEVERRHEIWIRGLLVEPDGCTLYSDFFVERDAESVAVTG
ncbi:hypothetical protein [Curtobacterium sp. 20TX0008]|uniref:hypothetical protein n=1 Tax=Curtobacterium sp. 20TX0008 TaxID=3022018 RepID=UPI00232BA938|nr:hypothetical protein [Curtobacterium sp. 20TX0008]MDB6428080.1 hypothetical protein [Curtobacterium sp. 20TX0008]